MTVVPLEALPLGFRFHPTDEELVNHYLKRKINGRIRSDAEVIPEIDLCKCEPWDLPDKSLIRSEDPEWFFFSAKDRKYPNGHRANRATKAGYWKATGKDRFIRSKAPAGSGIIGMKKTLVFHQGRAPKGVRTHWIMHEYRATEPEFESGEQGGYVLYRLFRKTEEKSSCSNGDEMERSSLSPAPTKSSPDDTTHEGDVLEELGTPIGATPDLQEEQPLSPIVEEQTAGITRWLADKGDRSSLKQENSHCNSHMALDVKSEDVAKAGGANIDPLLEALEQFYNPQNEPLDSIGFPNISSPMLPYSDHPFLGNNNQESYMGFGQGGYMEQDPMIDILNSILNNQDDCYSGGSNLKPTSTTEAMHSRSSSELDTEFGPVQGAVGFETPGWCYADMSSYGFPEFDNGVENSTLFPYNNFGPDVYSFDSGEESLHGLFNGMDESTGHKNVSGNGADLQETGIDLRPSNQLPNVGHFAKKQGNAKRRVILSVTRYSISSTECESGSYEENYEDREAAEEVGKDENSSIENELSSVKEEEKDAKEVGENEDYDHIAKERDISECMPPCKHKNLPICDDAISLLKPDEVAHSEIFQEAKPTALTDEDEASHSETSKQSESLLRLRTKSTNETIRSERLKITSLKMERPGPNVTVSYIRVVVLLVILLLICVGIWSWGSYRTPWIAGAHDFVSAYLLGFIVISRKDVWNAADNS